MLLARATLALLLVLGALPAREVRAQEDPIASLMARSSAAVRAGDADAYRATMTGAPASFVRMRMRWFEGIRALELDSYELVLDLDGPLSYPARRRVGFEETTIRAVLERFSIAGYDTGAPQVTERFLTFGRRGSAWSVIADDELADLGLDPPRELWDLGRVHVRSGDGILVVTRGSASQARTFAREIAQARERVGEKWPFGAPERIVALVPGSVADLIDLFSAEFEVERFIGFASSSWWRDEGEIVIGGRRLVVNPRGFFAASAAGRADILGHEVMHLTTSRLSGMFVPAWLEEGIAQYFGERSPRSTRALRGRSARLPDDHTFATGDDAEVSTAYRSSLSFVRFAAARHGRAAVARFYRALGAISAVSAGTRDYHLDRASRSVFDEGFPGLVRDWQAEVRKGNV